jgi:signal peptidase I
MVENATAKNDWLTVVVIGRNPRFTLVRIVFLVLVCIIVFKFILLPIRVQGISMLPTYRENRVNFVNRLSYTREEPKRGDVVAIRYAGTHLMLMKRIVGLPGETVEFRNGRLLIDGQVLPEPYLKLPCNWNRPPEKVGPNQFYVVGDNRSMGESEHEKGRADRERIIGKVML